MASANNCYFPPMPPPPSSNPSIVSTPLAFSDPPPAALTRFAAAATRIQRAVRGFLVRKNVAVARKIEAEVDEIEMRFRVGEDEIDLIATDEKERLRINEMLMALLFRLDSVRGVRDYRKRVIRRAIAIQELLDSISSKTEAVNDVEADSNNQEPPLGSIAENSKSTEERMVDAMERVVADNEVLKGLMSRLCENGEEQCRLISMMTERLEKLEMTVKKLALRKQTEEEDTLAS